jgi:hypothetical protein
MQLQEAAEIIDTKLRDTAHPVSLVKKSNLFIEMEKTLL